MGVTEIQLRKIRECSKRSAVSPAQPGCAKTHLSSGKAAAAWMGGAYKRVREHGQGARTPLAAFFNTPQ